MEFSIKSANLDAQQSGCIVVGVFELRRLSEPALVLDAASGQYLSERIAGGDMDGKTGSLLLLHKVPGIACERVLLIGLGKEADFNERAYRDAVRAAVKALTETGAADGLVALADVPVKQRDTDWRFRQAAVAAREALYRFDQFKSRKDERRDTLRKLDFFLGDPALLASAEKGLAEGVALASGVDLAKNLGNLPGNVCTPTYLAEQAQALAKRFDLECKILERDEMEALGMNALLSVTRGSHQPPKFIVLQYHGDPQQPARPFVLVGKGITFDTGGISLKPPAEMDEMKYDMSGAASVLGTMKAVAKSKLPIDLTVIMPCVENMPGGNASRPGDIITSMSGQTVEILNTDAEGRLILCDALTYSERLDPVLVVDVATLTGACVIALGHVASGLFSNAEVLAHELLEAGETAYDRIWQLPLWDEYQESLKSNFADMANVGGRPAGTITAARFLSRFATKFEWAHLDIAGTAWKSGTEKGSTGRPVPLLFHFLLRRAGVSC